MREWFVQLFSKGLPWVALVVVTGFGLRQLQLRKSAQSVAPVPLSATVPISDAGPRPTTAEPARSPLSPTSAPVAAAPEVSALPAHVRQWYAATEGVEARPPVSFGGSRVTSAYRRMMTGSERTHALLATARARAAAEADARARCAKALAAERTSPPVEATPAPDPALVRWALRVEDVASGDDVRRRAALRAAREALPPQAAGPLMRLAEQSPKHSAAAAELAGAKAPGAASVEVLVTLLAKLPAEQQVAVVTRTGLTRFTHEGGLAGQLFREPGGGAAAQAIAAMGIEQQAQLDTAARARLRTAALEGLSGGAPGGVAASARLLAFAPGALSDAELALLLGAFDRLGDGPASQEAKAALLTVLAHKLSGAQRARDAKDLRRRALDAMASEHAIQRAAGHRLAVSLSAHALLYDPYAPHAKRRAVLTGIEAAWQ